MHNPILGFQEDIKKYGIKKAIKRLNIREEEYYFSHSPNPDKTVEDWIYGLGEFSPITNLRNSSLLRS